MGHIFFIMGVSGSGKGTLIENISKLNLDSIKIPLSYKTRALREGEEDGTHYNYLSKDEFFAGVQRGEFIEYALVHETDYYGTKYEDLIEKGINKGYIVIKEIDINGLENLRKSNPELDDNYTTIFLNIPEVVLVERIEKRGAFMTNEELNRRINSAINEEKKAKALCDYLLDATCTPEEVLDQAMKIIKEKM